MEAGQSWTSVTNEESRSQNVFLVPECVSQTLADQRESLRLTNCQQFQRASPFFCCCCLFVFSPVTELRFRLPVLLSANHFTRKRHLSYFLPASWVGGEEPSPGSCNQENPWRALCECCVRSNWNGPAASAIPAVRQHPLEFQCLSGWIIIQIH